MFICRILIIGVSAPVVLVDELLKVFSRARNQKLLEERKKI
jgi:Ca2+-transporting ATPase